MQHHNKDSNYEPTDITFTLCDVSCRWFSETLMAAQYNATSRDAFSFTHCSPYLLSKIIQVASTFHERFKFLGIKNAVSLRTFFLLATGISDTVLTVLDVL